MATMLGLSTPPLRIGNEIAEENMTTSTSTLSAATSRCPAIKVRMTFPAKSGKGGLDVVVTDRRVAGDRQLKLKRSRRLFTVDDKAIDSTEINALR